MRALIEQNWDKILGLLETQYDIHSVMIDTWIRTLKIYDVKDNTVYFYVDEQWGNSGVELLRRKGYDNFLMASIREVLNNPEINIVIEEKATLEKGNYNPTESSDPEESTEKRYSPAYYAAVKRCRLNKLYTFENYIIGEGNRHAYSACVAVADEPSQDCFNPLFVYGNAGIGKTHLIQSIAHYILQRDPDAKVLYATSDEFTTDIVNYLRINRMNEFREKYRQVDVLIIDDIQGIIGKEQTQNEFFNTFNFLYESGKQIILSSDRPPKEFEALHERFRSRFAWGVPIDIHAPDYETRMAILKNKAELKGMKDIPEEVFRCIAENIVSNVRDMEGTLNLIKIYYGPTYEGLTSSMAKDIIRDLITDSEIIITPEYIMNIVASYMNVSIEDIQSKKRNQEIATARQLVMYLSREFTDKSLQSIGETVGGKDHATVYNGIKKVKEGIKSDPKFADTVNAIIRKIKPDNNLSTNN